MERRPLGRSGLEITPIILGTWPMSGIKWSGINDRDCIATIQRAIDLGVNMIDTAYMYGKHGEAEALVGKAVRGRRDQVLIATKGGLEWAGESDERILDCSYERLMAQADESLRRMGIDTIDLYQVHVFDDKTPIEETARALADLRQQGKVRAVGVSNYSAEQVALFHQSAALDCVQPLYNMLYREAEADLLPYCREHGIATIVYRPLERGLLTDKIKPASAFSHDDSRRTKPDWQGDSFERTFAMVQKLKTVARELGKSVAQLVLNWTIHQPGVAAAVCGARRPEQVEENVAAADWRLSDEDMARVTQIVQGR